jgi:hypothetical protein
LSSSPTRRPSTGPRSRATARTKDGEHAYSKKEAERLREQYDRSRAAATEEAEQDARNWWRRGRKADHPRKNASPWLLIRYRSDDLGLRPTAPGDPFWASPDVWVESSDPAGQPVAGEPNYVVARVFNLGYLDAAPTKVDFYWGNPAIGLAAADMHLIGTEWVEVPALQTAVVKCQAPWVPDFVNNGHECVMVNCSNHILDPIILPFQPKLDRHVGQRNLHVLPGTAGGSVSIALLARNLLPHSTTMLVTARMKQLIAGELARALEPHALIDAALLTAAAEANTAAEMRARLRPGTAAARSAAALVKLAANRERLDLYPPVKLKESESFGSRLRIDVVEKGAIGGKIDRTWYAAELHGLDLLSERLSEPEDAPVLELGLKPREECRLEATLELPAGTHRGELVVLSIGQLTERMTIGGYTIVAPIEES